MCAEHLSPQFEAALDLEFAYVNYSISHDRTGTRPPESSLSGSRLLRVAIVCDYLEEGWPSMDLFGEMLFSSYRSEHPLSLDVEQLRPPFRTRFSIGGQRARLLANADRLINRFHDYPRWLQTRSNRFDLFHLVDHSYAQLALNLPPERTIITCHDLDTFRCLLEPEREQRSALFRAMVARTLKGFRRAVHVICPSEATRRELLSFRLFAEGQVTVINPGADPVFFSPIDPVFSDRTAKQLGVENETFLLHVGSTARRKRIDLLLRIFSEMSSSFPRLRLVRVGGPFSPEQEQMAADLGVAGKIIHAPRLTKEQLAAVYRKAALLVQPSDAEGFGLPVIEACACGCPVLASDVPALREAGGTAIQYCAVGDLASWREALSRLLVERGEAPDRWHARVINVREHASHFTWSENAKQTLAIYRRAYGNCAALRN